MAPTPERKPAGQSWESFAERRLREAIEEGKFANLPGFGKPIPGIDEPWDENSWVRQKLKDEQINALPPILEARLRIEQFRRELPGLTSEHEVRRLIAALNEFIRSAHYSHIPGPPEGVASLEADAVVEEWRRLRALQDVPSHLK